jgi:HAD superfamily hydrolase (TIGR01509 family)
MEFEPTTLLFDLDGVIVNSADVWLLSLNTALEYFDHKPINLDLFNEKFWGNDVNNTLELLGLPKKALDIVNKTYLKNIDRVEIFSDVELTLKYLKYFKKGIITNTPKIIALYLLEKFNILKYFNIIVTSDDVKYGKPNPEIIIKACKLLGVQPKEVVIIGDTISDIEAGKNLECKVIGININADYNVNKFSKILDILIT